MTYRKLKLNERRSTMEDNAIAESVSRMENASDFDNWIWQASGMSERRIARIVGAQPISSGQMRGYEYRFLDAFEDGSRVDSVSGTMGGASQDYAYESSNNLFVPIDGSVIVELRPGDGGVYWEFDYSDRLIVAKITGHSVSGLAHSWTEQMPDASYPSNHALDGAKWIDLPGGRSGTTIDNPAFERNYAVNIPNDTIVYLHRGYSAGKARVVVNPSLGGDGSTVHSQQSMYVTDAVGGTFTLTFDETQDGSNPQTTAAIAYNANAAAVKAALEALSNVTTVTVTGSGTEGSPFIIRFDDDYDSHLMLIPNESSLLGDQWWVFDWPQNIQDLNVSNLTVSSTLNVTTGAVVTFTDVTFNIVSGSVVNVDASYFNFTTTTINITGDSYFLIGGNTTVIIGDPIVWGKPKVVPLVTNVCLHKKTFQVVLGTQTEVPDATWVDIITTTFSLEKTTAILVWGVVGFDCNAAGVADDNFHAELQVDGASETTLIKFRSAGANSYAQPSQVWKLNLLAGSHTLVLRAKRFDGTGSVFATVDTTLTVHADDVLTVEKTTYSLPNGSFYVSQECVDSPTDCCTGTGSGGTGSTPGTTIATDCCTREICETLTATLTGDIVGTATLTYTGSLWEGDVLTSAGQTLTVMVSCVWRDPDWVWRVETSGCYASAFEGAGLTSVQCDPTLELVVPETTGEGCGEVGVSVTYVLTISESADCTGGGGSAICCGGEASMPATLYGWVVGLDSYCLADSADLHNVTFTGAVSGGDWVYSAGTLLCGDFSMTFSLLCTIPTGETERKWVLFIESGLVGEGTAWVAVSDDATCDYPGVGGFYASFNSFTRGWGGSAVEYPISVVIRRDSWV